MSLPSLREHQSQGITALRQSLAKGNRAPVFVSPTGSGKTRTAIEVVRMALGKGSRVLFLAPRRELIYQASANLDIAGIPHGVIMAGEPTQTYRSVQVASFDTLWARREKRPMPVADLVLVDEAHLSVADSRKAILEKYPDARIVGLTATPARGDGRGLGEIYDDLVVSWGIPELQRAGYLVPIRYFVPSKPDLDGLKLNASGDYRENQLAERVDKSELIGDVVHNWFRLAHGRQTVVFSVNRAHSRHICEQFRIRGVSAEHLDGETELDERKAILRRVASGETTVLCNVFVATYGLDIPTLQVAVLARPTRNLALYLQMAGRVLRPAEGKSEAIIIDHAGAVDAHGRVEDPVPWSLDTEERVSERKKREQAERKELKEITCGECSFVFAGQRDCPMCGHQMIPPGQDVPTHDADLQELDPAKENRKQTWDEKREFIGGLRAYARRKGYREGWVAHAYRSKFGVWPNDKRVAGAPACEPNAQVMGWIKHLAIRAAKRKEAAA